MYENGMMRPMINEKTIYYYRSEQIIVNITTKPYSLDQQGFKTKIWKQIFIRCYTCIM